MSNAPTSKGRAAGGRQGSRILVIGCGFIGSNVAVQIAETGEPPLVLTRHRPAEDVIAVVGEANLRLGDAADIETVASLLHGIDHVAFCAGGLLPSQSEQDPERDRELTLTPVRATMQALRERPGTTLTYLSSGGTVYGNPERLPVDESAPVAPVSAYGRVHLLCEEEIEAARVEHGLDTRILRCSTVYGEQQRPGRGQGAIVTFLDRIARGEPVELFGDGSTIRDYVYVGDIARAIVALMNADDVPHVLNVGSGEATSLIEVMRLVEQELDRPAEVIQREERGFDVHQIVLDTTLLHRTIELEMTPLATGIARTQRWLAATSPRPA